MMSIRYCFKFIPICVVSLVLGACVEAEGSLPAIVSEGISFGISEPIAWPDEEPSGSRAAEMLPKNMGCYAFINSGNSESTLLIANGKYERNASNVYTSQQVVYWPGAHATLDFYNYAPYSAQGLKFDSTSDSPSFSFEMPLAVTSNYDLLLASARNVPGNLNVPKELTFKHALSAIKFTAPRAWGQVEISIQGLHRSGKITFDDNGDVKWSLPEETIGGVFNFTANFTIYFVPQKLDNAEITVAYLDKRVTVPLSTDLVPEWLPGQRVNYQLSEPQPTLDFHQLLISDIDAHYSLCRDTLSVNKLAPDSRWTLTAEASDGADVTVQHYEDVNEFAKAGYWTDKYMNNGSLTEESARGSASIDGVGNGDFDLMVFVPENVGQTDRTINLSVTMQGESEPVATQSFTQLCPDWANGGWERVDDNERGMYGLYYTTRNVYVYNSYNQNGYLGLMNSINAMAAYNDASRYTNVQEYRFVTALPEWGGVTVTNRRFYVDVDYSQLNALGWRAQSETDGLTNTRELFAYCGSGITRSFETALQSMRLSGGASGPAFRHRSIELGNANDPNNPVDHDPYPEVPVEIVGGSQALAYVLKKNRYNIDRTNDQNLGQVETPRLSRDDIVWYMPASGEFNSFGTWPSSPSEVWSSTAASDDAYAKDGSGTSVSRPTYLNVRARRIPVSSAP